MENRFHHKQWLQSLAVASKARGCEDSWGKSGLNVSERNGGVFCEYRRAGEAGSATPTVVPLDRCSPFSSDLKQHINSLAYAF